MTYSLAAPRQTEHALARLFVEDTPVRVRVSEQIAFRDEGWLDLGHISLHAAARTKPELLASVRNGSFLWNVPGVNEVRDSLRDLFGFGHYPATRLRSAEERLPALLNSMASIAVRTGLARPRFDAKALAEMPFRRPTTIVADTSGVLQGAMSFVADHLHPMARLKVPAILHMEVINQADRFLKTRRSATARGEIMLGEHLLSQTGQRTLLRLELREDTEVERNLLVSDPLRSAFKEDRDPDLRELNLATPLRSYVDRMILESALQHQNYASPGHAVRLLTADQGLAKMAIAEGIKPLFFRATTANQFFGRPLTGSMLHPFSGELIAIALPAVLWELATAFGRVRLDREGGAGFVEVVAIDRELGWSSYHSDDDLLWTRQLDLPNWPVDDASPEGLTAEMLDDAEAITTAPPEEDLPRAAAGDALATRSLRPPRTARAPSARASSGTRLSATNQTGEAFYRLRMGDLVALIDRMAETQRLTLEEAMETLATKHPSSVSEYRRFLESAEMVTVEGRDWVATERLVEISTALREVDRDRLAELLTNAPSYRITAELARSSPVGAPLELPMPARVQPTYQALGELTGILAAIPGEGIYPTPARPSLPDFTRIALERYRGLGNVDGWVSVGEWLEALIREDGIHPTFARDALQEADGAGLLHRSTEGSTTDTRHDDHNLRVLRRRDGRPAVETVHLYRGDFLIPDKSSSSLRLQETAN